MRGWGSCGLLWLTTSALCVAAEPALSQTTGTEADSANSTVEAAMGGLAEITVTARRREESLQRTPISVVAISAADLEKHNVTSTEGLQQLVPNVTFAPSQNVGAAAANIFIRGIGQEDFIASSEPGVGFYVDGVYLARTMGDIMGLLDIDRMEVLRGPQGTLFGKNTIGGAINVVSVQPRDVSELQFTALAGNYDRTEYRGVINEPLSDHVFVRLAAGATDVDGYQQRLTMPGRQNIGDSLDKNAQGGNHTQAGRLQVRWEASDTLNFDFSADGSRDRGTNSPSHLDAVNASVPTIAAINTLVGAGKIPGVAYTSALVTPNLLTSYAGNRNYIDQDVYGVSLTAADKFGDNSLKFITAYRHLDDNVGTDIDGSDLEIVDQNLKDRQHQYSGELQWNGVGFANTLNYTLGLFALAEKDIGPPADGQTFTTNLVLCGCYFPPTQVFTTTATENANQSYAGYAQGSYELVPKVRLTLGARYSYEKKKISSQLLRENADLQPTDNLLKAGSSADHWGAFTYRAGLDYQVTADAMLYTSVAKGYKSGGFNGRPNGSLPNLGLTSFNPEVATTEEIGARTEWFEHHLRFNATLFNTDYNDLQLRSQVINGTQIVTLVGNAAKARIRGAELEVQAAPAEGLTLGLSYGRTDAKYLRIGNVPGITTSTPFQRSQRDTLNASADYEYQLSTGSLLLHTDWSFRSHEQFQLYPSPFDQNAYGLLGASIAYKFSRYTVSVFGTNLTDKLYRNSGRYYLLPTAGLAYSGVGAPREFGARVIAKY